MIIDLEHHISTGRAQEQGPSPSGYIVERQRVSADGRVSFDHLDSAPSVEQSIQFMDEAGIDMAVRTSNASGEGAREANDMMAKAVRDYPKRYIGEASIPIVGGKHDLDEVDRAINGLGLKGVHISTHTADLYLDSREMWPFYEKVSKLNVPIDVHVDVHISDLAFDGLRAPYALHYIMAREFDMAASVLRVCLGGVLEDFPDLVFIMNHFGGGVSSVLDRLDLYWDLSLRPGGPDFFYKDKRLISKHWREYFNKLNFNMAGRGVGMDTVKCALTNISPKRLMFGTDWPFNYDGEPDKARQYIAEIRKLDLPQEDIDGMLGGNAAKVFGIQE
ncbi:amidohydrolase family protein [Chloroflexota bacterium]